jgi:hypothetical protein
MRRPGIISPNFRAKKAKKFKGLGQIPGPSIPFAQVGMNPHNKKFASLTASPYILGGRFPRY